MALERNEHGAQLFLLDPKVLAGGRLIGTLRQPVHLPSSVTQI